MSQGKSVRMFLADGTPGGLLTAEIMNWTGHVLAAPRSELAALLVRPEIGRTGVYLLLGDDPDSPGGTLVYIGETDDVGERLKRHAQPQEKNGKDFWSRAVLLTSKDMNLTKAHVRYLESRLIEIALDAKRAKLVNGTQPASTAMLPEADASDMEQFIEQVRIVLPVLGINVFRSLRPVPARSTDRSDVRTDLPNAPLFQLRTKKDGVVASAREVDGEFTVLAGSRARAQWGPTRHGYQQLHGQLVDDGTLPLAAGGEWREFAHDTVFASPSAAAAVVLGRPANGRQDWRASDSGITYGDWQTIGVVTE
ncbi:hypothetical protein Ae406Ps2_1507c [Pseudonocardia sp. Ae406_Ps2]|uniref:GIY-YIG nuclease family protein n=1 Tax=unclassified Pseudonocardia TaxID=2619320 RepID=UPI00094B72C7|nr:MULTISPECIES: GIY-YIG nuclease family protein [unclassified Pseudonocardia]OLM01507.1 hypothetical protein Ae406Ps2_1507c [Pseudonocardia sp. Ae406_Ps2]OLM06691.1 hypothetical protein Ae331Ps2_4401 [Pseudonocardia sp. Ae331_Ps2]OLM13445.1 hypothetical protein Ae505Ps2_3573 [Pseudonocardia sp. Ae505_Ps2]OLM23078.1 hypothetical protein Ae706Ps2_1511c [Pseudonocardia sp. Ae706_Ps2]OLM32150.1 hypothetical protein Ae717Ps2_3045c [Pseudonocardia sp. Ae717_Ps2]